MFLQIDLRLQCLIRAAMPQQVARLCLTESAGSAADMIFLLLDASPGDKNDRETVYSKVISSAPMDENTLYQHLVDWRFARVDYRN